MKKRRLTAAAVATACLLILTLAGCGGTNDVKSASEPVAVSQAFGQKSVWVQYNKNDAIDKDGEIDRILVFDGNGNVTAYQCDGATFADLNGKSDDEIVEMAKKQDKKVFDTERQDALDSTAPAIEHIQSAYDALKDEYDSGTYTSWLGESALSDLTDADLEQTKSIYNQTLSELEALLNAAKDGQAATKSATYQEPKAQPYTLRIETDGTGNNTQSETISFDAPSYSFYKAQLGHMGESDYEEQTPADVLNWGINVSYTEAGKAIRNERIELFSPVNKQTVYDTTFAGFSGLATIVNENHAGFVLDTPDTKGIEVD
nr:MAG TPA: ABC-type Fe3+ transport system, periplasmic binding protein [Bacteriophage sp.]